MRTLVIDCATDACSAALFDDGNLIAGRFELLRRGHAERLIPMIAELPDRGRAARIAVALGPGSFTGIRVGLAAAKGLALAWRAELVGYRTPELLAAQASAEHGAVALAVVNTGGHGEWFVQEFAPDGKNVSPVRSLSPEAAVNEIVCDLVVGSQAEAFVAKRGAGTAMAIWPDARQFACLPSSVLTHDVHPAYGRGPDAKLPAQAKAMRP